MFEGGGSFMRSFEAADDDDEDNNSEMGTSDIL
jgi:hypothetical protein